MTELNFSFEEKQLISEKEPIKPQTQNISKFENALFMCETNLFIGFEKLLNHFLIEKELNFRKLKHSFYDKKIFQNFKNIENFANFDLNKIERIGHRGNGKNSAYNKIPRENVVDSFNLAYFNKAEMIELDVHLTKDNVLVVFHDSSINNIPIYEMTFYEFIQLTNSDMNNYKATNTTLENILNNIPEDLGIYVEIKYNLFNYENYFDYGIKIVLSTLRLLDLYHNRKFMIASFSPFICALLKLLSPYKICFIVDQDIFDYVSIEILNQNLIDFYKIFNFDGIVFDSEFYIYIKEFLETNNCTKIIYGSGSNDIEKVREFKKLGITGFCTDNLTIFK